LGGKKDVDSKGGREEFSSPHLNELRRGKMRGELGKGKVLYFPSSLSRRGGMVEQSEGRRESELVLFVFMVSC